MPIWTKPVVDRFVQLFADPAEHRYAVIAEKLSSEFGLEINKNMCIGIGKRLNMPHRKKTKPGTPRRLKESFEHRLKAAVTPKEPKIAPQPYVPKPAIGRGTLRIDQLKSSSCRWPFGESPPFLFCGHQAHEGSPYCTDHTKISRTRWVPSITS